jgi:hypothetical protein
MPGAARIVVDKHRNEYTIERYWDYNVMVDDSIKNIDQAALGLYERLDKIFAAIDRGGSYIMGLSGGIDSRITLGFLSKYLSKDQLEVFTYGYDARILEHTYAKSIAEALSFNRPEFHKLSARSYMMARDYMVERSGGQLSMDHCHMLDFFLSKSESLSGKTQISNYFTDAIFGWDCEIPKKRDTIEGANLFTVLRNSVIREKDLVDEIAGDVRSVLDKYNPMYNYSKIDEYKYVTERNQKFHMLLAAVQNQYVPTTLPYADYDLLRYMISVPIEFRTNKKMVDYIIDRRFGRISSRLFRNISSRDFKAVTALSNLTDRCGSPMDFFHFKFLNRANALLRPLTEGHLQLFNKYQTEEQERLLYRDFSGCLHEATTAIWKAGIFSWEQKKHYDKLPLRSGNDVGERYRLMSLSRLVASR